MIESAPKVRAAFLPPLLSSRSRENLALSSLSRSNRAAVLSYNWPLNELPCSAELLLVDSSLHWIHGETCRQLGATAVLRKLRAIALERATLRKDI